MNNKKHTPKNADKNGVYTHDGRTMLFPYINNNVVYVKKGVQNLSYSISNDSKRGNQDKLTIKKIVFEEGVDHISEGWHGLHDNNCECHEEIDISLPSTIRKINQNAFGDMINVIRYIYIPRRYAKKIKSILPSNLIDNVKVDRFFFTRKKELIQNPLGNLIGFCGQSDITFDAIPTYLVNILFIIGICIYGYSIYLNTFLPFHFGSISILIFIFGGLGCISILHSTSEKVKQKSKIKTFHVITNWCLFISLIAMLACSAIFVTNKIIGKEQYKSKGKICAMIKNRRHHTHTIEIQLPDSKNIAEVKIGTDTSYDNVAFCTVYYHKGFWGMLVTDSITH